MKLSVTNGFIDKETTIYYPVGTIVEFPEKRAKEIEKRGFGVILNEPKPTKVEDVKVSVEKPKTEKKSTKKK